MTTLLVINRLGTVHAERNGHTCNVAAYAPKRVEISALQARVYKLAGCRTCFPLVTEYERIKHGGVL